MAFLMLLHEKMRLQRKVNKLTYKQLRASGRKERVTKQIERVQKMYSARHTKLQKMAEIMQKQFQANIYNTAGLGTQGQMWNPYSGGLTSFVYNTMGQLLANGGKLPDGKDEDGKAKFKDVPINDYEGMMREYQAGTLKAYYDKDSNGADDTTNIKGYGSEGQYSKDEYQVFMTALSGAQSMQSQAQMACQQMTQNYQSNISIWLEQQENQLDLEQDEALLPLQEQETEWDMESQSAEVQLQDARARLDSIKQALSEGIKDSAPTFGLG